MAVRKKHNPKYGYVLKEDVMLIIQNYIRNIQMNDYSRDEGIPQLYNVMKQIENMPVREDPINEHTYPLR